MRHSPQCQQELFSFGLSSGPELAYGGTVKQTSNQLSSLDQLTTWACCYCILGSMAIEPVDEFLLRYVVTYKCRALLDLLTDKDQRVLTFAARGVVQEMPGYEYRLLLSAWRNQGSHLAEDLPRFGGAF